MLSPPAGLAPWARLALPPESPHSMCLQHWMLPMLLNTYGKLRQADKAWAIYQQLLKQQKQQPGGTAEHAQQEPRPTGSARQSGAAAPTAAAQDGGETAGNASGAAKVSKAAGDSGGAVNGGAEGGQAWQARLAQRQARLAAEAERLVEELDLGAFPLNDYAYSTIITALSRVGEGMRGQLALLECERSWLARSGEAFSCFLAAHGCLHGWPDGSRASMACV